MEVGEDPTVVAKVIVTAATERRPNVRYTAVPPVSCATRARRLAPAGTFDQQMREDTRLPA
ncbi:hypothetical protein [Streptomyces canus]|uniref:hypothetical protein n=1 Tax=Streptomyces canus TaxID=58343 RepID=UPI003802D02B